MPKTKKKAKSASENKGSKSEGKPPTEAKKSKKGKKKGKTRKGKKAKIIDWTSDEVFDPNRCLIYIEHSDECPIFKTKAMEFLTFLQSNFTDRQFVLLRNSGGPPRDGAFEIQISQNARTPLEPIWSGINKGPPRREKFPENYNILLPETSTILNKIYMIARKEEEDDDLMLEYNTEQAAGNNEEEKHGNE